jgi:hypothetical protein
MFISCRSKIITFVNYIRMTYTVVMTDEWLQFVRCYTIPLTVPKIRYITHIYSRPASRDESLGGIFRTLALRAHRHHCIRVEHRNRENVQRLKLYYYGKMRRVFNVSLDRPQYIRRWCRAISGLSQMCLLTQYHWFLFKYVHCDSRWTINTYVFSKRVYKYNIFITCCYWL